jgi:uncharacterized membrane protein YoaK (UPF0700 family)
MDSYERIKFLVALALTAIAGCVDAIGLLKLKHLFVSFMSGDSTHIAVAIGGGRWLDALAPAAIVALYLAGVIAGRLIAHLSRLWHRPLILLAEAALLLIAALVSLSGSTVTLPMALAMGMQSAAMHRVGQTKVHLTYVTGTLVNFAEKLTDALIPSSRTGRWQWLPYLLQWLALVAGAALGALGYGAWSIRALIAPTALLVVLALITFVSSRTNVGQIEPLGGRA